MNTRGLTGIKKLSGILFLQLLLTPLTNAADVKQCIGALNAFQKDIKDGKSPITDHKWVRGSVGSILLKLKDPKEPLKELMSESGKAEDIFSCTSFGMSAEEIKLFLLAFHGYLPSDPYEGIAQCYSVMLSVAPELDKAIGAERAQALGFSVGGRIGVVTTQLGYLFSSKKKTMNDVTATAQAIATSQSKLTPEKRAASLKQNVSQCALYDIPLESALSGAGVGLK